MMTAVSCIVLVFVVARQAVEGLSDTTTRQRSFETGTTTVDVETADSSIRGDSASTSSPGKWATTLGGYRNMLESETLRRAETCSADLCPLRRWERTDGQNDYDKSTLTRSVRAS